MKKIFNIFLFAIGLVLVSSCDKGFDEMNTSKVSTPTLDPVLVLNTAILNSSPSPSLTYELAIVQQWITSNTGVQVGGNFNQKNVGNTPLNWINYYQNVIRYTSDVISRTSSDPTLTARTNLYNMARIVQANAFMVLTDIYGDIPYSAAGQGNTTGVLFPSYDTQASIYPKIIQELTDATASLNASGIIETTDVLYTGNIVKWKKFGYSLLLRAGMHLTKADAAKAQAAVATAFAGGVITTNADNAIIKHDANYVNGFGNTVNGTEAANFYLAAPFVDALKGVPGNVGGTTSVDPRLSAIAIRYGGAKSGSDQVASNGSTLASDQFGMPVGSTDGVADLSGALLPPGGKYGTPAAPRTGTRFSYSQVDRNRMVKRTSPLYLVTAGQTNLLLAEATRRGWVAGGDVQADQFFKAGIRSHMDQMESYDAGVPISGTKISTTDRDAYVAIEGTLNVTTLDASLAQIGYQYWVASFLDGPEAWTNFRRIGYPALAPNPFSGSEVPGSFINRIYYPPSEALVNKTNYDQAVATQGADNFATQMWLFK